MNLKSISIVIVNWNSGIQLSECIESINKSKKANFMLNNIIIVDNASNDSSLDLINNKSRNIKIIKNNDNIGFGKACNQGAIGVEDNFILFLNPDMLIYEDTFLNLFNYIEKNDSSKIGIYGVQLQNEMKIVQKTCARLPSLSTFIIRSLGLNKINSKIFQSYTMQDWDHLSNREVDQVMGAFFMIKRDIFEKLNGFDERFFVYYEELDLSKRVKDASYKTVFVSEARAYHKGGGTSENVKAKRLFYNTRSRIIYGFKHFGLFKGSFLLIFTFLVEPFSRTFFLLLKRKYSEVIETFKGFGMLYKDTFNIIKLGLRK